MSNGNIVDLESMRKLSQPELQSKQFSLNWSYVWHENDLALAPPPHTRPLKSTRKLILLLLLIYPQMKINLPLLNKKTIKNIIKDFFETNFRNNIKDIFMNNI